MKNVFILTVLLMSFNVLAEVQDWYTVRDRAITTDGNGKGIEVMVSLSTEGQRMIWISTFDKEYGEDVCKKEGDDTYEHSTLKVNGTNVKTILGCKFELGQWYTVEYALTKKGEAYILKQFRKSEPVVIDGFSISSKGFNKVWDHVGGDAI